MSSRESGRLWGSAIGREERLALGSYGACLRTLLVAALLLATAARGAEVLSPEEEAELREKGARPVLEATPATLVGTVEQGGTATLAISIRNAGGQVLRWSVSFAPAWAKVVPESGELAHGEGVELVLAVDGSGLQPGSTRGDIVIAAGGAQGSPAKVGLSVQVRPRGAEAARTTAAAAAAGAPGQRRFRFSVGAGFAGMSGLLSRTYATGYDDYSAGLQIFAIGFQLGSWEFILGGNPDSSDGYKTWISPVEWYEWKLHDGGPYITLRRYWRSPVGWRPFAQAGVYPLELEVYTESGSDRGEQLFVGFGAGLRWALRHGYFELAIDALNGGGEEVEEFHSGGISTPARWKFNDSGPRFTALLGLTF